MIVVLALIGTMAGMAVPQLLDAVDNMRLGMAMRDVERELQFARLKSVGTNRPMRVRFNCPIAGQFRAVELIGTPNIPAAADTAADRCSESVYPYRSTGADNSRLTRPNNDGPLRRLQLGASFTAAQTLEFRPDGSVHADAGTGNPWPVLPVAGSTITVTRKGESKSIKVNTLGKIQMDR
jgi:type II secretory pathway pseudopilin PulG